jgi:uncharacterized protein
MQTKLAKSQTEAREKHKRSLANALNAFSKSIDEMTRTLEIWMQQMSLMKQIINDKLKRL